MKPAVFLDRDGVLNALVPDPSTGNPESPLDPRDVSLLPGAAAGASRIREAGYLLVAVSNQPAAAKGTVSVDQLHAVHDRVLELLEAAGAAWDASRICLHHPDGSVPELTRACDCRKPGAGMLLDAATELGIDLERSWMIGDTDADVAAGAVAGCRTVLLEHCGSAHKRGGGARPTATAADLPAAVQLLLAVDRVTLSAC